MIDTLLNPVNDISHYPVMYKEVREALSLPGKKVVLDCTIGIASHALKFLEVMDKDAFLIGIDKDEESLIVARERLSRYACRVKLIKDDFRNLDKILEKEGIDAPYAIFFDLGISNYQLSNPQRGFSIYKNGPLDMRMDRNSFVCAYDLVNNLSEGELAKIFKQFGEERFSQRIAHRLVEKRKRSPITTTEDLKRIVWETVPHRFRKYRIHPATRVFQALRIAVNRELEALEIGLNKAISTLKREGRIAVLSFHSLEDRIVKYTFRKYVLEGQLSLVNSKPLIPSDREVKDNPSSRSAKLRVAQKLT